jgi:hypothetical protein
MQHHYRRSGIGKVSTGGRDAPREMRDDCRPRPVRICTLNVHTSFLTVSSSPSLACALSSELPRSCDQSMRTILGGSAFHRAALFRFEVPVRAIGSKQSVLLERANMRMGAAFTPEQIDLDILGSPGRRSSVPAVVTSKRLVGFLRTVPRWAKISWPGLF